MPMLIPGIYILLLLAAAVVLAFVLEVRAFWRVPAAVGRADPSEQELDHPGVLSRLATLGGPPVLAAVAVVIVGYSANPQWTSWVLRRLPDHPAYFLLFGAVVSLVALLCGVKPRQPTLLVCLTLPGLLIMALVELPIGSIVFFLQPGVWILLFIGIGQARLLRQPGGSFTSGGLVRVLLISFAYVYGFIS